MPEADSSHAPQQDAQPKFAFGRNWQGYLQTVNEQSVRSAEASLCELLGISSLESLRFLDAGSGSGLFSLAAYRLGASVTSFDMDPDSVACTRQLQSQATDADRWQVLRGSLLDQVFMESLPAADVVYCWGVAHHTGDMWTAIDHLIGRVTPGGKLVVAIYNDQQYISRAWQGVKRIYQRLPVPLQKVYVLLIWLALFLRRLLVTLAASGLRLITLRHPLTPLMNWFRETRSRGMNSWHDLVDWIGGWPFEVARPEEVFRFLRDRGFTLNEMTTSGGHGCNEFVFQRDQ